MSNSDEIRLLDTSIDISGATQLTNWSSATRDLSNNLYKRIKSDKTNQLLKDQQLKIDNKNKRYENINTDSNSFNRINILKEQKTVKSDYTITTLKYILIFLMLSVLPLILERNKIIDENVSKIFFVNLSIFSFNSFFNVDEALLFSFNFSLELISVNNAITSSLFCTGYIL